MESADCNAGILWPQVGLPEHRCSACRAKMHSELSSLLPVADIDFGRSFGANVFLLEVRPYSEHGAGSPLTLAAMAGDDRIRIGGYFDTHGSAGARRGSPQGTPPSFGIRARALKGGRASGRRL